MINDSDESLSWKNWNDFKTEIKKYNVKCNGKKPYNPDAKVALILMNPKEWKATWNKTLESQTNMTFFHLWSISEFGENTHFNIYLMDENTIIDELKNLKEKYAFICESGMVFNIKYWKDKLINEDVEMYKCHIMAQEKNKAWNHPMNIWLNLESNFKIDDLFKPYEFQNRSEENHHDDYTPFWVDAHGTRIHNFTSEERDKKAWSYHKPKSSKYDEIVWSNVSDSYHTLNRIKKHGRFYYFNNEDYHREWNIHSDRWGPFDVMLFPTSGLNAERFCMESKYKGKLIIYDHTPMHLKIKKDIHNLNPGIEGYEILHKYYSDKEVEGPFDVKDYPEWGNDAIDWVNNNCEIEYRLMDLMTTDYDELAKELKDKKVLFHHSNIFTYDLVSINYTFKKIRLTEENMRSKLIKATNQIFFSGESAYNLGSWENEKTWINTAKL